MKEQYFQRLNVYLKGGQTVTIDFNAEKADALNAQIEDFIGVLGKKAKQDGNYLFRGARLVLIRLSDVSAVDVVSFVAKGKEKAKS